MFAPSSTSVHRSDSLRAEGRRRAFAAFLAERPRNAPNWTPLPRKAGGPQARGAAGGGLAPPASPPSGS